MWERFTIPMENILRQGMTYFSAVLQTVCQVEKDDDDSVSV